MKTYFEILSPSIYDDECTLVCEVSNEGIACTIKNEREQKYIGVAVYNFDKSRPQVGFPIALQILFNSKSFFSKRFKKVSLVFSVSESVLIPFKLYDSSYSEKAISLLHGDLDTRTTVLTDVISESECYNCFRMDEAVHKVLEEQFPNAHFWHQYSVLMGSYSLPAPRMFVIFYSYKMVVAVFSDERCQLINSYPYQCVEDVSFYLLSICEALNLKDIDIEVSGFIEKNSALYQEVYKYFKNISFAELPEFCKFSEEILLHPSHYFSHMFALDLCG